jgi:hypothetical protein
MSYEVETLYALLPAYLRGEDEQLGRQLRADAGAEGAERSAADYAPLRGLIALFAEQFTKLGVDTEQLYDDLFIETCAEWVIPHIGDLVGARLPPDALKDELNPRALVADTISDRRRKGTPGGLERVADAAVASWLAKVTEYWPLLIQSQNLNHLRTKNLASVDLRHIADVREPGRPFDPFAHTIDVRSAADGGRYNIGNMGIDVWRVASQSRRAGRPFRVAARRYTFDPFGRSLPLFVDPDPLVGDERVAARHVPTRLTRRKLHEELPDRYGDDVELFVNGARIAVDDLLGNRNIEVCRLEDDPGVPGGWINAEASLVTRVDPELGRMVLASTFGDDPEVEVTYHYGAALVVGGGSYERDLPVGEAAKTTASADLVTAVLDVRGGGEVVVTDSLTVHELTSIVVDRDATLVLAAANGEVPGVSVAPPESALLVRLFPGAHLIISGFWIHANLSVVKPEVGPATLTLVDTTIVPGRQLSVLGPQIEVRLEQSIVGSVRVASDTKINAVDSVIDATAAGLLAIASNTGASGGALSCRATTIIGRLLVDEAGEISNSLLVARGENPGGAPPVVVRRQQVGCVRHSYVPFHSKTPRRFHCVPAESSDRSTPVFASMAHGAPEYLQLDLRTPLTIRGASDQESEMGALHRVHQRAREIVLADRLEEFLRFGMQAGIHYAS